MSEMLLLAAALSFGGVLLLWRAWQFGRDKRARARRWCLFPAWVLIVVSVIPWRFVAGADRGVALALLVLMLTAFGILTAIGWREIRRPKRRGNGGDKQQKKTSSESGFRLFLRRTWIVLLAGPVCLILAIVLALNLYALTPNWHDADRLTAALFFVPIAWGMLSIGATYHARLRLRSTLISGLLAIGIIGIMVLPGATL